MISSFSYLALDPVKPSSVSREDAASLFIIEIGEQGLKSFQDSIVRSCPQAHWPIAAEH